jgi:hypothetical protein
MYVCMYVCMFTRMHMSTITSLHTYEVLSVYIYERMYVYMKMNIPTSLRRPSRERTKEGDMEDSGLFPGAG